MINVEDKSICSGCSACANVCPKKIIKLQMDNEGFYYPQVKISDCIDCKLCEKVCPYITDKKNRSEMMHIYGCQLKDDTFRKTSTSGGIFYAIAQYIISLGGVVYGAAYNDDMHVVHMMADSVDKLTKLQGSKYVQSELGYCFNSISSFLSEGRYVFFTGTPCQVEGLLYYLNGKNTDRLYTADIKCYGVPSPGLFDLFQKYLSKAYGNKVKEFYFRDKKYGYAGVNVKAVLANGISIEDRLDIKSYSKTMFSKLGLRRSCYSCIFSSRKKLSDFTFGDCWNIYMYDKGMDDDKGTTSLEVHSKKGSELFENISDNIRYVEIDSLEGKKLDIYIERQKRNYSFNAERRKLFFLDMHRLNYPELMNKYFPDTLKNIIDNIGKPLLRLIPGSSKIFKIRKQLKIRKSIRIKA